MRVARFARTGLEKFREMASSLAAGNLTFNPLYKEVKIRITRGLAAGEWKPGAAIPSESRLARQFDVSIGTVRKAIDELVAENILLRQQGRGTFVATHTEDRTLFFFFHIVGKDGRRELPLTEMLSFRRSVARTEDAVRLKIQRGSRTLRIRNVLKLGAKPVIFDDIVVPAALFPGLDEDGFAKRDGTIYGLYQARYGINVIRISERLSAQNPSPPVAALLGSKPRAPVLLIKRVAYTYNDTPVEHRVSWVNTEAHEYLSDLWKSEAR
jgi:GntR family transcriptional regulator